MTRIIHTLDSGFIVEDEYSWVLTATPLMIGKILEII